MYRLLQVTAQAYAPSGLASGNGSATSAAKDAYAQALQADRHPPRRDAPAAGPDHRDPRARHRGVQRVPGDHARAATTTDRVTVVARLRNVLVTVEFSGLDHARQGGYGPVSPGQLAAGAAAAARDVLAKIG